MFTCLREASLPVTTFGDLLVVVCWVTLVCHVVTATTIQLVVRWQLIPGVLHKQCSIMLEQLLIPMPIRRGSDLSQPLNEHYAHPVFSNQKLREKLS